MNPQQQDTPPGQFAQRWPEWTSDSAKRRREIIARKLQIYSERQKPLIERLILERLKGDEKAADLVRRFATSSPNLARSVVDAVAVAYSRGCQRTIADADKAEAKVFAALVDESGMDRLAPEVNAISWLCGPVILVPCISERGALGIDILVGDRTERKVVDGEVVAVLHRRPDGIWFELDATGWTYIDEDKPDVVLKQVPHGLDYCPAVPFRSGGSIADWWQVHEHTGLIDATLDVGYKLALGLWYRQVSGNKMTVIWGHLEGIAPGQSIGHPALPLYLGPKGDSDVQVYDRIVSAGDYLSEIRALIIYAIGRYGIQPSEVVYNGAEGAMSVEVRGDRLGKLRDKQVRWLRQAERALWPIVCDMVKASGRHRLAGQLPDSEDVRERLRVYFPDLATPGDQKARIEAMVAGLPFGLTDPTRVLLEAQPEITPEDAEEIRSRNMQREIQRALDLAAHNLPADPARGVQTIAQAYGRQGGQASGEVRRGEREEI